MRRITAWGALWAGLLMGALLPGVVPALADDARAPVRTTVTLRLAPAVVTYDQANERVEPTGLVAQVRPIRAGVPITFKERINGVWQTLSTTRTNPNGRFYVPLRTTSYDTRYFQVVAAPQGRFRGATSQTATLYVVSNDGGCRLSQSLVDPAPSGEAVCLAARLDRWQNAGLMGVGQQLNVSNQDFLRPLGGTTIDTLTLKPAVVGFDLEELAKAGDYEFPFQEQAISDLLALSRRGAILTASWHATNPGTGGPLTDLRWRNLKALLDPSTPAYATFWSDFDEKMELLRRFQEGDGNGVDRTAVVFRPLHEANGAFFWWGKPDPATYKKLWRAMQDRAWTSGVHNIVWAYSFNRRTVGVDDPAALVPRGRVDIGGLDTYDPEKGKGKAVDALGLEGYSQVKPWVPRMALTEVGPHGSVGGAWNPAVVTTTVKKSKISPLWAMLWFDDKGYANAGKKQLTSLRGGRAWLSSCFNGLCYLR